MASSSNLERATVLSNVIREFGGHNLTLPCCELCGYIWKREGDRENLLTYGKCKIVRYCSKDCQKWAWKSGGHKIVCGSPNQKYDRWMDSNREMFKMTMKIANFIPTNSELLTEITAHNLFRTDLDLDENFLIILGTYANAGADFPDEMFTIDNGFVCSKKHTIEFFDCFRHTPAFGGADRHLGDTVRDVIAEKPTDEEKYGKIGLAFLVVVSDFLPCGMYFHLGTALKKDYIRENDYFATVGEDWRVVAQNLTSKNATLRKGKIVSCIHARDELRKTTAETEAQGGIGQESPRYYWFGP